MRTNINQTGAIASILLTLALGGCTREAASPRLSIPQPSVELGVLDPGKHDINVAIENGGGQPLQVGPVSSSCSCTVAEAPTELVPGAKGMLRATVTVAPGPGAARLAVASNDPTREKVVLISWFGKSTPRLLPSSVILSPGSGEVASRDVEVCYAGGDAAGQLRYVRALNLPDGATLESVSEEPSAIRTIPGLGASAQEAPSLVVGKTVLRLKYSGPVVAPLQQTATIVMEQRGATYELPLPIAIAPHQILHSSPSALMFGADTLAKLMAIERKAVIIADSTAGGGLEVARKPDYLDVQLVRSSQSPIRTMLLATVTGTLPAGTRGGEVVLRDAGGVELVIPVYLDIPL